jgi:putative hydrolase of the HAD superfamily
MIRHLLLDLDNTLYRASWGMDEGITRRMLECVARHLGVSFEEGMALRAKGLPRYGTTLEWLKAEHGLTDEAAYFEAVHPESELAELKPDPALRSYLLSLGLPMTLLTNSPMAHADRVLRFYGIEDLFTGIYDITFHKGKGKPHSSAFLDTLVAAGFTVDETLFVDDLPKYVRGYKAVGGQAVIVDETGRYAELAREEDFGHISSIYELGALLDARLRDARPAGGRSPVD